MCTLTSNTVARTTRSVGVALWTVLFSWKFRGRIERPRTRLLRFQRDRVPPAAHCLDQADGGVERLAARLRLRALGRELRLLRHDDIRVVALTDEEAPPRQIGR